MKQITRYRDFAIKRAPTIREDRDQNIETTLTQLRENIVKLQNTRQSRSEELEAIRACDRLAVSDELEIELLDYFCEFDSLRPQAAAVREGEAVIACEMSRLRWQITQTKATEKKIAEVQVQIDELVDKLTAYRLGQERIESNAAAEQLLHNPHLFLAKKRDLADANEATQTDLKHIAEDDQQTRKHLQSVIDEQTEKITQALEAQQQETRKQQPQSGLRKSPKGKPVE
jgi:hypothetical protein